MNRRSGGSCIAALTLVVQLVFFVDSAAEAKNVALLIAVGQLHDPQLKSQQLLGTAADLESLQQTLTTRWGFAPKDVRVLRDQDATHDRILDEISALEERSASGDTIVIYFSGHGTSANAHNNQFDLPYATGAWVPYDVDGSSQEAGQRTLIIGRRDLVPRLKRLDEGGRWVVVISDSCYSGQVVRSLSKRAASRYLSMSARDLGIASASPAVGARPPPPPYPYHHVVLLSGASDSETGADISSPQALHDAPTVDGKYHGAFTDAFLRLLTGQLLPGTFNYTQAQQALDSFLEHRNFAQHPQLLPSIAEDPDNIGARVFLNMTVANSQGAALSPTRQPTVRVRLSGASAALTTRISALANVAIVDHGEDLLLRQSTDQLQLLGPAGDPIVATTLSDPTIERRIAAQAWLNRVLPSNTGNLGLRAETNPGSRGNTFVQCETFVFNVRLEQPAYLLLLDLDAQGRLTVLYPERTSEREIVAAGQPRAIPGEDARDRIRVTPPFGLDQVTVFAVAEQPAFLADLVGAQPFTADSSRAEALAAGLRQIKSAVSVTQISVSTYPSSSNSTCLF